MQASELAYAGIARQAQLIAAGEVSSRELVEVYLERIARHDPLLNAFRVVFAERALLEADQADSRRAAGAPRPLLGVPIAVKDDIDVAGEITAWGTNAQETPAPADAEVVRRLREAGAVILGKTNVPEMTLWPFTETATFGVTRNPWNVQHTTGGSSGGSGAAVAAGLVGAALGSDGAGSIRIPSAWCGLVGLKPQRGRVSLAPRARAWHGMSVDGVLTRRVVDTALFHDVASGSTDIDADKPDPPGTSFAAAVAGVPGPLRIAVSRKFPGIVLARLDPELGRALDDTAELLRTLGHTVQERDPDYGNDAVPNVIARYMRGAHDDVKTLDRPERLERRTRTFARIGGLIPPSVIERSFAKEPQITARINGVLQDNDFLVTPAVARTAPPIGALQGRGALMTLNAVAGWVPYNGVWNLTGQPAIALPAGFSSDGLPLSVQIVARPGAEGPLLSLAAQLEAARPWAEQVPSSFA